MPRLVNILTTFFILMPLLLSAQVSLSDVEIEQLADSCIEAGARYIDAYAQDSAAHYYDRAIQLYQQLLAKNENTNLWRKLTQALGGYGRLTNLALLDSALILAKANLPPDDPGIAICHQNIAGSLWHRNPPRGLFHTRAALNIWRSHTKPRLAERALCNKLLGLAFWKAGELDSSIFYQRQALEINYERGEAGNAEIYKNYLNMALVARAKGDMQTALHLNNMAFENWPGDMSRNHSHYGQIYNNLGRIYHQIGDYDQALSNYRETIRIWEPLGRAFDVVTVHFNIGVTYAALNKLSEARQHFERYIQFVGPDHVQAAVAYDEIGKYFLEKLQKADSARFYFEKSRRLRAVAEPGLLHPITTVQTAKLAQATGDYQLASKLFIQRREYLLSQFSEKHPDLVEVDLRLAECALAEKDHRLALNYTQRAIVSAVYNFDDTRVEANPQLDMVASSWMLLEALTLKSTILHEYGVLIKQYDHLDAALETVTLATALIDKIRNQYRSEDSQLVLAGNAKDVYSLGIGICRDLYSHHMHHRYMANAFQFSEKSKSAILWEKFIIAQANAAPLIPDSLRQRERALLVDIAYLQNKIMSIPDTSQTELEKWEHRHFLRKDELIALQDNIKSLNSTWHQSRYQQQPVNLHTLQSTLKHSQTLVEYFIRDSTIDVFIVAESGNLWMEIARPDDLEETVDQFRNAMITADYASYVASARALYATLFADLRQHIKTDDIVIVPDESLLSIPFEALLVEQPSNEKINYAELPYLLFDYRISYSYSATMLTHTISQQRTKAPRDLLAFAPVFESPLRYGLASAPAPGSNESYSHFRSAESWHLSATREELNGIRDAFHSSYGFFEKLFRRTKNKIALHIENEASKQAVIHTDLTQFNYVHFATHAVANPEEPLRSGLQLAKVDSLEGDGVLRLNEVYTLELNAELVVLSACETGMGKLSRGEGMIGLARGFWFAGARNILASLWQVNDRSTSRLMVKFYQDMLAGT